MRSFATACAAALLLAVSVPNAPSASAAEFVNGNAFASAVVVKITPGVGSLGLSTTAGVAVAEIKNALAQSQAQSIDLGLIGTALTAEGCTGGEGTLTAEQLPHPTRVDNRKGNAEGASDEVPIAASQLGGGREAARATSQPLATATATMSALGLAPLLSLQGGQSMTTTRIIDKKSREAAASVDANIDLGGVVQLRGLRWDALHRTGAGPATNGEFSIQGASIGGVPLPISLDALAPVQTLLNQALAPLGLRIELPVTQHITEPVDLIRVSPLRLIIEDSPAGATALRPVLEAIRVQKEQLFTDLATAYCQTASALLIADIMASIAAGAGFLAIDIGGVQATTAEVIYENPFGSEPPLADLVIPGIPGFIPDPVALPLEVGSPSPPRRTVAIGPVERVCESVHPFKWPSCSQGALPLLGILGIVITGAVVALDWRYQRRRLARQVQQ